MFILSAKLNSRRIILFLLLSAAVIIFMLLLFSRCGHQTLPGELAGTAGTDEQRTEYLASLGWEASPKPIETLEFSLPSPLNQAYEAYNELQQRQGFDLSNYAGMQVKRYSYTILNYPGKPDQVQADLYLCGDTIIGGDILYGGEDGFVDTLIFPK